MAVLRKVGNLASMLLQARLANQSRQQAQQAGFQNQAFEKVLSDPTGEMADRLTKAGMKGFEGFVPKNEDIQGRMGEQIAQTSDPTKLDDPMSLIAKFRSAPGAQYDPTMREPIEALIQQTNQRRAAIRNNSAELKQSDASATALGTGQGTEQAKAEAFPAEFARTGQTLDQRNNADLGKERSMTPILVDRANKEAWAKLPAEIELEKQKRTSELALVGDKIQAEELAKKTAAIKGLMPTYLEYRRLALTVAGSWAGAGGPSAGSALDAIGHIPAIGGAVESGIKSMHTGAASMVDPELGRQVGELNRLTMTLAQGMANAVLGNKGQTTENDRRTAENILASSFTDINTAQDLLKITDRMFMLLPSISASQPNATPGQIIQQAADQAKAEAGGQASQTGSQPSAQPSRASQILQSRRRAQ